MGPLEDIAAEVFREAVVKIVAILARISDFGEIDRKTIAYYILATHILRRFGTFPILLFKGVISGGKSSTIPLFGALAFRVDKISLYGMTHPALRDEFEKAYEGTTIVEEADKEREDAGFEIFLQNRYARDSAITSYKVPGGDGGWVTHTVHYYGATIVYRRTPFANTAVNSRSITITVKKNRKRKYEKFKKCAKEVYSVHKDLEGIDDLAFELPEFPVPDDAAGRIIDTYQPLLSIAMLCGDQEFLDSIIDKLKQDTLELDEDQGNELGGIVFRAYLQNFFKGLNENTLQFPNVWTHDVHEEVRDNHKIYNLTTEQISKLLRHSGFSVKQSHGRSRVVAPDVDTFFRACEEWGCENDDAVIDLRQRLGLGQGQEQEQDQGQEQREGVDLAVEEESKEKNTQRAVHGHIEKKPYRPYRFYPN